MIMKPSEKILIKYCPVFDPLFMEEDSDVMDSDQSEIKQLREDEKGK